MDRFIAFEGGEGGGKSTQARLLGRSLAGDGREVVVTREPGATPVGAHLRAMLLDPASALTPRTEVLLYLADRAQHVDTVIAPALRRGAVVVTDRYADSTIAYQGAGRGHDRQELLDLTRWAAGDLQPALTVLLDVDPRAGLARVERRAEGLDRMEQESLAFHDRIRQSFLDSAAAGPGRYLVVDATRPAKEIAAQVLAATRACLALCCDPAEGHTTQPAPA